MRRLAVAVGAISVICALAGCDALDGFPPVGGPAPAEAAPVRIDRITIAGDRQSLLLEFVGGPEFDPNDPCSIQYEAATEFVGPELEVGLLALPHPMSLREGAACDAMGHARTLIVKLDRPFEGTRVRDRAGDFTTLETPE